MISISAAMPIDIRGIIETTDSYNFHAHTQFCDGRDTISSISAAAADAGFSHFAFTPHSPVPIISPCNMDASQTEDYFREVDSMKNLYCGRMKVYTSMEIDWLGDDWGPHIDYFQKLPLDFRLGSVHFVPSQDGTLYDCDGSFERFRPLLETRYAGDVRYVVEKYFEQVIRMLERGGLDLLGHFDKIAGNASKAFPALEDEGWYEALVDDVISHAVSAAVVVEINTKAWTDSGRFFPAQRWWSKLLKAGLPLAVDSDAHWASKVGAGRAEAFKALHSLSCRNN